MSKHNVGYHQIERHSTCIKLKDTLRDGRDGFCKWEKYAF